LSQLVTSGARARFGSGQEVGLPNSGGVGGGDIAATVADEHRAAEVKVEIVGGAEEHPRAGFAVDVLALVVAEAVLGVVGAVVDGVERHVAGGELGAHPGHEGLEVGLRVKAASDAGLVGNDDELVAGGAGGGAEIEDAIHPDDLVGPGEEAELVVDDAIAVEEESGSAGHLIRICYGSSGNRE